MSKVFDLPDETATDALAKRLAAVLKPGHIVLLKGGLGAGKTRFVRGVADAFGLADEVSSPTFTLMNLYHAPGFDIHHFDLYRLEDEEAFFGAGLEEQVFSKAVSFVEWPECATSVLAPEAALIIEFSGQDEDRRKAAVSGPLEESL